MARHIVEYKIHGNETPYFIEDGGYYPIDYQYVGITRDDSYCYIPDFVEDGGTLLELSNSDLVDRVVALDMKNSQGESLSTEQKTALANTWLTNKGFA